LRIGRKRLQPSQRHQPYSDYTLSQSIHELWVQYESAQTYCFAYYEYLGLFAKDMKYWPLVVENVWSIPSSLFKVDYNNEVTNHQLFGLLGFRWLLYRITYYLKAQTGCNGRISLKIQMPTETIAGDRIVSGFQLRNRMSTQLPHVLLQNSHRIQWVLLFH